MSVQPALFPANEAPPVDARARILVAGLQLLSEGGRDALTTRAVAATAGVQQPTLYRLFGDKDGLLDAVAEHGLAIYVATQKQAPLDADPLADFRAGCDRHVAFGLAHPALFSIIWGDPRPGRPSPAGEAGFAALRRKIRALADAGLLRVGEERAAGLTHAACTGAVLALLAVPEEARDAGLAVAAREAVVAAVTVRDPLPDAPGAASATRVRAELDGVALTPGERLLFGELLGRVVGEAPVARRIVGAMAQAAKGSER